MKPQALRRNDERAGSFSVSQSTPSMHTRPAAGRSRPPSRYSSVLLPEPLGPITDTTSARDTVRDTSSRLRTSTRPVEYVCVTAIASTAEPSLARMNHPISHDEAGVRALGYQRVVGNGEDGRALLGASIFQEVQHRL